MLELRDVHSFYGIAPVLKAISLKVETGRLASLIGPNGAGKTTLLWTISGLVRSSGRIEFEGERISGLPPHRIAERGIAHVPQGRRIFPKLSVMENLEMGGFIRRKADPEGGREVLGRIFGLFPVLEQRKRQMGGTLSGGEQQMLAIGRALMARPKFILLDEPSLGLAPIVVREVFATIRRLHDEGFGIFVVEQNANMALNVAHYVFLLENGRIVLQGETGELRTNERVIEAYLGKKKVGGAPPIDAPKMMDS